MPFKELGFKMRVMMWRAPSISPYRLGDGDDGSGGMVPVQRGTRLEGGICHVAQRPRRWKIGEWERECEEKIRRVVPLA